MKSHLLSSITSGLVALGLVAGMSVPAVSAPITQPTLSIPQADGAQILPVRDDWAGGNNRWQRRGWNGNGRWQGNREWHGNREWRGNRGDHGWRGNRDWRGDRGWGGAALGLGATGLILGLGMGGPAYADPYYDPYYGTPRYATPRRVYRTYRASDSHIRWCYDRYRSYRAADNTFQPNHGPRRQCRSPY